jgi:hypothetical protein
MNDDAKSLRKIITPIRYGADVIGAAVTVQSIETGKSVEANEESI